MVLLAALIGVAAGLSVALVGTLSSDMHNLLFGLSGERLSGVAAHPLVRKVLERFPGAKIVDVRGPEPAPILSTPEAADDEDAADADPSNFDDDV